MVYAAKISYFPLFIGVWCRYYSRKFDEHNVTRLSSCLSLSAKFGQYHDSKARQAFLLTPLNETKHYATMSRPHFDWFFDTFSLILAVTSFYDYYFLRCWPDIRYLHSSLRFISFLIFTPHFTHRYFTVPPPRMITHWYYFEKKSNVKWLCRFMLSPLLWATTWPFRILPLPYHYICFHASACTVMVVVYVAFCLRFVIYTDKFSGCASWAEMPYCLLNL